jgi:pimeloyl-ACP methyl ester carboxylesterase
MVLFPQIAKTKSIKTRLTELAHTKEGFVTSFDGTKIWYRSVGEGTPMVFCNGLGCSTFYFTYLEDYFKRNHQVVTFDYRGHGRSDPPHVKKNHTLTALKLDLKAVMNGLKIKKAIMLGHSMGTQVLYEFYFNFPKRCLALIPIFGTFQKPMDTFYDSPASKYVFEIIYIFNHLFPKLANKIQEAFSR